METITGSVTADVGHGLGYPFFFWSQNQGAIGTHRLAFLLDVLVFVFAGHLLFYFAREVWNRWPRNEIQRQEAS